MPTVTISLSPAELQFVQEQVAAGGFSSPSGYVMALVHAREQLLREPAEIDPALEAELLKGLDSGPPVRADDEFWKHLRAEANERAGSAR